MLGNVGDEDVSASAGQACGQVQAGEALVVVEEQVQHAVEENHVELATRTESEQVGDDAGHVEPLRVGILGHLRDPDRREVHAHDRMAQTSGEQRITALPAAEVEHPAALPVIAVEEGHELREGVAALTSAHPIVLVVVHQGSHGPGVAHGAAQVDAEVRRTPQSSGMEHGVAPCFDAGSEVFVNPQECGRSKTERGAPPQTDGVLLILWVEPHAGAGRIAYNLAHHGTEILLEARITPEVGSPSIVAETPWNPDTMHWLQLREDAGTLFFEASADGTTFDVIFEMPTPFDVSDAFVGFVGHNVLALPGDVEVSVRSFELECG